jgi:Domain of unknown function (DUF6316)
MRVEDPRDNNKRYFRANKRVFVLNGSWFFSTREGEVGPFPSAEVAAKELERFKLEMSELKRFQSTRNVPDTDKAAVNEEAAASMERSRKLQEERNARPSGPGKASDLWEVLV